MTGEHELTPAAAPVRRVHSAPKTGLVGPAEVVSLSLSALLLLAAVVAYFYLVLPARSRQVKLENERQATEKNIQLLKKTVDEHATVTEQVGSLTQSLVTFEQNGLTSRLSGRNELYDRLNALMRENNLRNTAGPIYTVLDPLDPNAPAATRVKSGNSRFQSFFPGIDVNVTVEGSYAGIRRFVHDVEAMPQFLIVNAVELEDVTVNNSSAGSAPVEEPKMLTPRAPQRGAPAAAAIAPRTGTSAVSLRLDMTVYFRRQVADAVTN
jgi:hypothetical protein